MCCESDKTVGVVSAINSLIQSAACITFGIVTMLMYKCILTPTPPQLSDPFVIPSPLAAFTSSFYLQYFHSQNNCIAHGTYFWKDVNDTVTGVVTKSYQVHGIFIGYIVENGLWLLCTTLLFVGVAIKSRWIYRTYSAVQFTVILYDAILIVLFGLDFKSYREFQGNTKTPFITKDSMLINIIVMMLIVSRLVFFFILNITLSCFMHKSASRMNPKIIPFDPGNTPPDSPKRKKSKSSSYHYPGARVSTSAGPQPFVPQTYIIPQTYQTPRYPDVIGNAKPRYDSSSEEVLVSTNMLNRSGPIPIMESEPRNRKVKPITNQSRPQERNYPEVDYDSSSSIDYTTSESFRTSRGPSLASNYQDPASKATHSNSNSNTREAPRLRRESSSRVSEQLKNQRPWSYISPGDIPHEPNKLNQFYNSHLAQPPQRSISTRALPSVTDETNEAHRSANRRNKREYNDASSEREPLLVETRFPLYTPHKHRDPVYANLQTPPVKKKKNVRFNQRTHSLEVLETSFPVETDDQVRPRDAKKSGRESRNWSNSGEEVCTDEFFIMKNEWPKVEAINPNRVFTRQSSSVSSPNLIFDPVTNTARLVFTQVPNRSPRSPQDRPPLWNETSI